jgi:hypothetical protein
VFKCIDVGIYISLFIFAFRIDIGVDTVVKTS